MACRAGGSVQASAHACALVTDVNSTPHLEREQDARKAGMSMQTRVMGNKFMAGQMVKSKDSSGWEFPC